MIPLRVSVEGFMSYRDETELVFEGAPLWVLSGRNGAGKSAIFDAITYALYGVHRGGAQNAKALINHAVKSLAVEFDFRIGEDVYRVKRTLGRKGTPTVQAFRLDGGEPVAVAETETRRASTRQRRISRTSRIPGRRRPPNSPRARWPRPCARRA